MEASQALHQSLKTKFLETYGDIRIVIQYYANVQGMKKACRKTDIVKDKSLIEQFIEGFTVAHDHVDFIDVGSGEKNKADRKLKGWYTSKDIVAGLFADQ